MELASVAVTEVAVPDEKRMRLRYDGRCRVCGVPLPTTTFAIYDKTTKTIRCVACPPAVPDSDKASVPEAHDIDPGVPGASARREFERRRDAREGRVRGRHPRLGGLILALSDDPQTTRSWDAGAAGEEQIGARLNELASESLRVLHDRRVPGKRSNIDHLVVATTGVYVVDPKRYRGRPELRVEGGLVRPRVEKLMVDRRDRTKLVDGVRSQVDVVRGVVGDAVEVHGMLCFVDADWPLIGGSFTTRGIDVLWPKRLYSILQQPVPMPVSEVARLHGILARALRPA